MGEVPLSLRVDAKLKEKLESEARRQKVSADDLAERAIENYLDFQERDRAIMRQRMIEAEKGIFISEEAMTRWVESWGTDNKLPPPEPDIFPEQQP
ncbi:MAG: ribbon-helix-helix protein, CopG family [Rhizobiales bacterium]|nr:ribbon-helix-helix protein, CopG family [Hyphomicrobiales bacterium]